MDRAARIKAIKENIIGDDPELRERLAQGPVSPLDALQLFGRGYDTFVGAPTRAALRAGWEGENPLSAAYDQFGEKPESAPDFGMAGNFLADPLLIGGAALKGAKYIGQLGEMGGGVSRASHLPSSGAEFKAALEAAVAERPMIKDFVSDYSAEDLDNFRTFLNPDGKSGYAIKPDGDLINVFSSARDRGKPLMREAVANGPTKLDAFDVGGKLPSLYKKYGFNEIKREANWTPGGPEVVYMKKGFVDRPQDLDNVALKNALRLKALSAGTFLDE